MFKFFNAPGNPRPMGCMDWLFLYLGIASFLFLLFVDGASFFGYGFWAVFGVVFFLWRRGWIQHWMDQKRFQEQQERLAEKQRHAERTQSTTSSQTTSSSNLDTAKPHEDEPSTAPIADQLPPIHALRLRLTQDTVWSPTQALGLLRAIINKYGANYPRLSVVATKGRIEWELFTTQFFDEEERQALENTVHTFYPTASVALVPVFTAEKLYRQYHLFQANYQIDFQRAKTVHSIKRDDPLTSVAQAIGNLRAGETMRYTVNLLPPFQLEQAQVIDLLTVSAREVYKPVFPGVDTRSSSHLAGSLVGSAFSWMSQSINLSNTKLDRFSPAETQRYLEKLTQPLMTATLSITFDTPDKGRLASMQDVLSAVYALSDGEEITISEGYTSPVLEVRSQEDWLDKVPMSYLADIAPQDEKDVDGTLPYSFLLTSDEVAALWHPPHSNMDITGIVWANPLPPESFTPTNTSGRLVLGMASDKPVSLLPQDLLHHAFISGQTGMGKSNLLHNLIHQLIAADQGFVFLDPHGTTISDVIKASVVAGRSDKVLLLDLNNQDYPIPLNPFQVPEGVSPKYAFNVALWIMKSIYKSSWSEGQMETVIRRTLELVLTDPEATPLDMQRVLMNDNYRRKRFSQALERGMSTSAEMWWQDEYDTLTPHARQEKARPTLNRMRTFLDGHIELMTCHPKGLDFRKLIQEGYILLVNLHGDEVESEVGSLGAILFAQLFLSSVSLGEHSEKPRYYLIIDETHTFITAALERMFSEARKFGLSLIMADQWLGQLDVDTRKAIVNNRGTTISFAASEEEAPTMARLYEPQVSIDNLIHQDVGQAAVRSRHMGKNMPAFSVQTSPPLPPLDKSEQVSWDTLWLQTVQKLNLLPASEVRQWIRERYRSKAQDASEPSSDQAEERTDIEKLDDENDSTAED